MQWKEACVVGTEVGKSVSWRRGKGDGGRVVINSGRKEAGQRTWIRSWCQLLHKTDNNNNNNSNAAHFCFDIARLQIEEEGVKKKKEKKTLVIPN